MATGEPDQFSRADVAVNLGGDADANNEQLRAWRFDEHWRQEFAIPPDEADPAQTSVLFVSINLFRVESGGAHVTVLEPEKRRYPVEGNNTTEAAIHTTFFADLYAVLGDADGRGFEALGRRFALDHLAVGQLAVGGGALEGDLGGLAGVGVPLEALGHVRLQVASRAGAGDGQHSESGDGGEDDLFHELSAPSELG